MAGWTDDGVPPELEDAPALLETKLGKLCAMIDAAKYITVFTGAGISTSSGIPDYRGTTGLQMTRKPLVALGLSEQKELDYIMPTYAHAAVAALARSGVVKLVATSNHDGLHNKAGTPDEVIADIFGNVYTEKCDKCKTLFHRKVIVPTLGRVCDNAACRGTLRKTGTRMGGMTPPEPLARADEQARKSDLAIVLGSSLLVSPFCQLPFLAKKTVVVTLQETPYDSQAALKINTRCDAVMRRIMAHLSMTVPPLDYTQPFSIHWQQRMDGPSNTWQIRISGDPARPSEPPRCVHSVMARVRPLSGSGDDATKVTKEIDMDDRTGEFIGTVTVPAAHEIALTIEFNSALDPSSALSTTRHISPHTSSAGSEVLEFVKHVPY
ncbi:hypothetical protein CAOG_07119 [Capsaspora owczarzaki ATCC 30864]|uniref:hypothetical protein n=1 Tax=Capsaspora owczarzaki (strain ATCC 30864) TaxID=595528 RepID=UPI0003524A30|nr:hypothetical protein CAOG_07119 [Capsaspora owczarzaki ATCC 30864]|eukprot:XP_004343843.2 hypothetical protein CAOG_07119 [Capsaspora owczarzaki ATCC 30864]